MMANKLTYLGFAILGAGIGSLFTWQFSKKYFNDQMDDYKDKCKKLVKTYAGIDVDKESKKNNLHTVAEETKERQEKIINEEKQKFKDISESAKIDYTKYSANQEKHKKEVVEASDDGKPYVITPDEFGEYDSYETQTLWLYADGYIADDDNEVVDDVEIIVGYDAFNHFSEFDEDAVYVRNDELETDYEILKSEKNYLSEVI